MNGTETSKIREAGENGMVCTAIKAPWIHRNHLGIVILRISVGCMILMHGIPKCVMLLRGEGPTWLDPLGIGSTLSLILCVFAEFVCGMAVLLGFFTRLAALVLVFNFWVVLFIYDTGFDSAHAELPLLYMVCFVTLVCAGGGGWSIDSLMWRNRHCRFPRAPRCPRTPNA